MKQAFFQCDRKYILNFFLNLGLTYEALTGKQKQSVPHCEQIFSNGVLDFMEKNGHSSEARFVEVV